VNSSCAICPTCEAGQLQRDRDDVFGMREAFSSRAELGRRAEQLVADRLERHGFCILGRNVRLGRLELDVIARRGELLVFCEVRARAHDRFVAPASTMDRAKIARVRQAAAMWLRSARVQGVDVRFDVATVVFDQPGGRIEYYRSAF
jgi:putative endonuclease